jgi:hypothetical protein
MRTKNFLKHLIMGALLLTTVKVVGQATTPGNVAAGGTDFLGWDNTSPANDFPLMVRHNGNWPIDLYTNSTRRARLYHNTFAAFNGYTPPAGTFWWQTGYFALSTRPSFFANTNGAFSRLHLVDDVGVDFAATYAQQFGWRPWMRNGVTFTGNEDQGYIGQKYVYDPEEPFVTLPDHSDMVLQWSNDIAGDDGPDRLRFLFTRQPEDDEGGDPMASGSHSLEGLEGMRLTPIFDEGREEDVINVGIGDFFAGNLDEPGNIDEPTERLDVLDGRVRIRQLPTDPQAGTLQRYLVVDDVDLDDPEFGVIKWRNLPTGTGGADCDWGLSTGTRVVQGGFAAPNLTSSCPDRGWLYSIGTQFHYYKMQVFHDDVDRNVSGGLHVQYKADAVGSFGHGIYSEVSPSSGTTGPLEMSGVRGNVTGAISLGYGVFGIATGAGGETYDEYIHGVYGQMSPASGATNNGYGVKGIVKSGVGGTVTNAYGVHGSAVIGTNRFSVYGANPGSGPNDWAGYFPGRTHTTAGVWTTSDENLKTDIETVESATEMILSLHPKTYVFNVDQYPTMGLPEGRQFGFLAQELQDQFPEMVSETMHPAELDSLGNEIHPAVSFKAVNTHGLFPILIAAFQEQLQVSQVAAAEDASEMEELRTRLDQMEQLLAECCNRPAPDGLREVGINNVPELNDTEGDRKLRIQPNPFSESTTVFYMLERSGRAQLMANSADGKQLRVLQEANLESGSYQYEWNTGDLAAGIYYVTLLLDGQPVVKKAVKVNR